MTRRRKEDSTYKSSLESKVSLILPKPIQYETEKLGYIVEHWYTPDFKINENTYIEVKGYFTASDRKKHLYIKEQHPDVTIYFLFGKSQNKLNKKSNTTYADWCNKYGFEYSDLDKGIPKKWFNKNK